MRLKPCPFCGKKVSIALIGNKDSQFYSITRGKNEETRCRCRLFMESDMFDEDALASTKKEIKQELVNKWNSRV